jgi:NADH-quinone oxidoreductase subunit N
MGTEAVASVGAPPLRDWVLVSPAIWLSLWGLVVLLVDAVGLRGRDAVARRRVVGVLALAGALVGVVLAVVTTVPDWVGADVMAGDLEVFHGTISANAATAWLGLALLVLLVLAVALSQSSQTVENVGEYYGLLFWSAAGGLVLIAAEELLTLFVALETMTLCLYLLAGMDRTRQRSAEAGLKYFVFGSVASALFLFGLSLLYGMTGTTRIEEMGEAIFEGTTRAGLVGNPAGLVALLLVLAGLGFKVAAVPFHHWAPDAYEGAPAAVAGWIAAGSKLASFVALLKVLILGLGAWSGGPERSLGTGWVLVVALLAAVSMTYGNFAALSQRNLKRMLAYSSIAHAGYVLVGVLGAALSVRSNEAATAVLYYLVVFALAKMGAFAVAAWLERDVGRDEIHELDGLGRRRPALAVCVVLLMLSLVGVPPLAGFFGKLTMFMETLDARDPGRLPLTWLVALALLNSVVSAFYYLRVLKAMFLREPRNELGREVPAGVAATIVLTTGAMLVFGLAPGLLMDSPMQSAAAHMLPYRLANRSAYATAADPEAGRAAEARRRELVEEAKERIRKFGMPKDDDPMSGPRGGAPPETKGEPEGKSEGARPAGPGAGGGGAVRDH